MSLVLTMLAAIALQASPQAKLAPVSPPASQAMPAGQQDLASVVARVGVLAVELAEIAGSCEAFMSAEEKAEILSALEAMQSPEVGAAYERGQAAQAGRTEASCDADITRVTNELVMLNQTFRRLVAQEQATN